MTRRRKQSEGQNELAKARDWRPDTRIPAGMGIVVPAERIREIIAGDPNLKKQREGIIKQRRSELLLSKAETATISAENSEEQH
jgi:hypothetical protein